MLSYSDQWDNCLLFKICTEYKQLVVCYSYTFDALKLIDAFWNFCLIKSLLLIQTIKTTTTFQHLKYKSHEAQRDELFNAFAEQIQQTAGPLVQDTMEGCDEDEWSD